MGFKHFNLDSRLVANIGQAKYENPTPIQESAMPIALAGQDLIGTAQTGTGKTAAFVLPILNKLLLEPGKGTRALIITPTRELAEQIHETISGLKRGTQIRSISIYGGVGPSSQIKALRSGVDIVVACPGRLLDLMQQGYARFGNLDILVLDEADRMFDMGFLHDIKRILKQLPAKRQTLLFSATFPKEIERLASHTMKQPKRVSIGLSRPAHTVAHTLYPVAHHLKKGLLLKLLQQTDAESVLIFTRTKYRAKGLDKYLANKGFKVTSLHGNRSQGQRKSALSGFKKGAYQIMVATDIAARGLDIDRISHVINFDMPDTADAYIHRIGRTGRATRSGEAFTFITPDDQAMVRKIERIMKQNLERKTLPEFDYDVAKPDNPKKGRRPRARNRQSRQFKPKQRA